MLLVLLVLLVVVVVLLLLYCCCFVPIFCALAPLRREQQACVGLVGACLLLAVAPALVRPPVLLLLRAHRAGGTLVVGRPARAFRRVFMQIHFDA